VLLLETGVGPAAVRRALDWLADRSPGLLIAAGFAGGLREPVPVGSVLVAAEVVDADGRHWPTTWPVDPCGLPVGRLLSVPRLVSDPAEKRRLGQTFGALAVDMESAAVARFASERGLPFGCVRAVSDTVDTGLSPRLLPLLAGGRVRPLKLAGAVVRSPGLVRELARLARDTRRAADRLADALGQLLGPGRSQPATTMLTSFRGTMISFLTVLPAMAALTFSSA
jgi:adenosylhomocysteine nucleosidase